MESQPPNDVKIRFSNAYHAMQAHMTDAAGRAACKACWEYIQYGDGDLCLLGKQIIADKL